MCGRTPQVRSELHRHKGYEVEVEEANFVAAFRCAHDAAMFGMACQTTLVKVHWDPLLLAQPWAAMQMSPSGEVSFRGPRLAIGMCTGNAMRVQPCLRTGKMEYYGPIMNHAARVAVAAHGGQVKPPLHCCHSRPLRRALWPSCPYGCRRRNKDAATTNQPGLPEVKRRRTNSSTLASSSRWHPSAQFEAYNRVLLAASAPTYKRPL